MKRPLRSFWLLLLTAALLSSFFVFLFFGDNKYQTPPPYGRDGVLVLDEATVTDRPLFLIDGWLLTDGRVTALPTYIGEFSNLQRGDLRASPHGQARYELTLRYTGAPLDVTLSFPQLFSDYTVTVDSKRLDRGDGSPRLVFSLTPGDHLITVETSSSHGYYSGMYHPPLLGRAEAVLGTLLVSCIAYAIACFVPLALALFTLALWRRAGDRVYSWFGLLCCATSAYLSYYFVRLLSLPVEPWWYLVQSGSFFLLCFCVVRLMALSGDIAQRPSARWVQGIVLGLSALLMLLAALIPVFPWAVWLHGVLMDGYHLLIFGGVLLLAWQSRLEATREKLLIRIACTVFGAGVVLNLFFSNLFEPILFFWQFEWCAFFLVALFGAAMSARGRRVLAENKQFSEHLEDLVELRTKELRQLLQERKLFFADMAHDLKAPISATRAFIRAIREHDTGVDSELLRYIEQVEQRQRDMARRVQGMSLLNTMDETPAHPEPISVSALLTEVYESHHMAAEVAAIHLVIEPPQPDGILVARRERMGILFENLIFNALHATAPGGKITLAAELDETECHFTVADTGSGIPIDQLPHIFERFYVGEEKKSTGSGLGLYIVKNIVEEQGGEISVSSKPGQGTVFCIDLPLNP